MCKLLEGVVCSDLTAIAIRQVKSITKEAVGLEKMSDSALQTMLSEMIHQFQPESEESNATLTQNILEGNPEDALQSASAVSASINTTSAQLAEGELTVRFPLTPLTFNL